jgi:ERCC4-type nuclease
VNDLASSIVDGRYEEQKLRLRSSGIANCVYLVEGASLNPQGVKSRGGKADTQGANTINTNSIITALAATQVQFELTLSLINPGWGISSRVGSKTSRRIS